MDAGSPKPRKTTARYPVKVNRRKEFGIIDISKFRLPRSRETTTHAQNNSPRSPTYADGFEGREAFPIGRPMPIPQRGRLPPKSNKLRASLAELTLVVEKEVKLEYRDTPPSHSETDGHLHLKKQPTLAPYNDLCEESFISLPPSVHDHCGRNIFEKDEESPQWTSDISLVLDIATPGTISSPLARKELHMRKMKFGEHATGEEEEGEPQSLTLGLPQRKLKALPENDTGSEKGHKALDPSLFLSNSPLRHRKDELDGFQELATVSTRSRVYFSDSNESNDYKSSMSDEAHSEIHRTDEEHEQGHDAPPDKVSGKESDVEMEDSINSCLLQAEFELKSDDDIEYDSDCASGGLQNHTTSFADLKVDRKAWQEINDIWKPRWPKTSNIVMEADDIIINPQAPNSISVASNDQYSYERRLSAIACRALTLTKIPRMIACDSQVSVELGDTQILICKTPEPSMPDAEMTVGK